MVCGTRGVNGEIKESHAEEYKLRMWVSKIILNGPMLRRCLISQFI